MRWRVGQAPTAGLKSTKEQMNFDRVLAAVSQYYEGNADGAWKMALRQNAVEYNGKGLMEAVGASMIMAAGLLAADQAQSAALILSKTRPLTEAIIYNQHPQVCSWMVEISMADTPKMACSARPSAKAQVAPLACRILGEDHPLSIILTTRLTMEQQTRMRRQAQELIHDCLKRTFGIYSYQTMAHQWYWGRQTGSAGDFDESVRLLRELTITWEQRYSTPNSAMAVNPMVEQARVMVSAGEASVRVECLLGDALRRIDVLSSAQNGEAPILDAAELRSREAGMMFTQIAALRTLGRLHLIRRNLGAALRYFERAVSVSDGTLSEQSSVRQLCQIEVAVTRRMEVERVMGMQLPQDLTSRLPPISSIVLLVPVDR